MKSLSPHLHATRVGHHSAARAARPGRLNVAINLPSGSRLGLGAGTRALYVAAAPSGLDVAFARDKLRVERLCARAKYAKLVLDLRLVEPGGARGLRRLAEIKAAAERQGMSLLVRCNRPLALLLGFAAWPASSLSLD